MRPSFFQPQEPNFQQPQHYAGRNPRLQPRITKCMLKWNAEGVSSLPPIELEPGERPASYKPYYYSNLS